MRFYTMLVRIGAGPVEITGELQARGDRAYVRGSPTGGGLVKEWDS